MDAKRILSISLMVVGCCTLILSLGSLFDIDLSDTLERILGGVNLVGIGTLAYAAVKLRNENK